MILPHSIEKVFYNLTGDRNIFSLEHRFFNTTCLVSIIVALQATMVNLLLGLHSSLTLFTSLYVVINSVFYLISRFKKTYKLLVIPFVLFSFIALSFAWIFNTGSHGPVFSVYLLGLVLFTIILDGRKRIIVTSSLFINIAALFIIEYHYKDLITEYQNLETRFFDLAITYFFVFLLIYLSVVNLVKSYRIEKIHSTQQRDALAEKQRQILDSIDYASTIQNAILPSEKRITEILHDHFIFYRPKDIVSGDFYWAKKIKEYTLIVVADCTGHGIPGALMSILGISLLNDIVRRQEIKSANNILESLRNEVIESLHQEEPNSISKDGMDMSICVINEKDNTLEYAGANNPIYLIRNGELTEYKATRAPIGISSMKRPFEIETIELQKGDMFYMFSDGLIDQFGGENGKKFRAKRFKELLLSNFEKSLDKQKDCIETNFNEWISDRYDQIDDILVLGFKI